MGTRTNKDSWNAVLEQMGMGERRYIEVTLASYPAVQRVVNTPTSRRPTTLTGKAFATQLFTAVSASKAGDIRYLICLERTA